MHSYAKQFAQFITVTCLDWKPLLKDDNHKKVIIDSLRFLTREGRATIYAFVLMSNHFHLIWQIMGNHKREDVQRDFLKFTGQQILKLLRNAKSDQLDELLVQTRDRKYQVWERDSLGIELRSSAITRQKLDYIHNNPVKAGLCQYPEDYKYSSARFYLLNELNWEFLKHCDGD
ncbi:MAG: transposase [Flammeovirgaceae bacterium]|nr:transposase [Flammeovirgaceae bacterium]